MNTINGNYRIDYVDTISNMTKRFNYYGDADILRISFYKLYLKYKDTIRQEDIDCNGISFRRKLEYIEKNIEKECSDIIRTI